MNYSILTWNIHGADNYKTYHIPNFVIEKILFENKDFVIITEFIRVNNWTEFSNKLSKKYWIYTYTTQNKYENEVLILIRKGLTEIERNNDMKHISPIMLTPDPTNPNFLCIKLTLECKKLLYIIGIRIRDDDHTPQFMHLKNYFSSLPSESLIICGGDFNEWQKHIKQKLPSDIKVNTPRYSMCKNNFDSLTTWSAILKSKNGDLGKALIDHFLTRNISQITLYDYLWDFINIHNGYGNRQDYDYKSDLHSLPDHGILFGEIVI